MCLFFSYFTEVLNSSLLSSDTTEIQLLKDGSWSIQKDEKKAAKSEKVPIDDSIEIISDDVEVVGGTTAPASSTTDKPKEENKNKHKEIVDLTLSESDDDEPLAKRRQVGNPKPDSTIKFSGRWVFSFDYCSLGLSVLIVGVRQRQIRSTYMNNNNKRPRRYPCV